MALLLSSVYTAFRDAITFNINQSLSVENCASITSLMLKFEIKNIV